MGCQRTPRAGLGSNRRGAALSQRNLIEAAKRAAAVQAAQMARSGWIIGLGTGSTAYYALEELGRLMREDGLRIAGIPTSNATELHARAIGIPIKTSDLGGMDSLLSTAQMPKGVPVATVAINGAQNAGILAVQILAIKDEKLSKALEDYKEKLKT